MKFLATLVVMLGIGFMTIFGTTVAVTCEGNQTICCGLDGCMFVNCTDKTDPTKSIEGCINTTTLTDTCAADTDKNLCTPVATTTTPAVAPTTAPSAPESPDEKTCAGFADNNTCCAATDTNCIFISCIDKEDNPHTGCHVATRNFSAVCKDGKYSNTCPSKETTTQPTTPTDNSTTAKPSDTGANTADQTQRQRFDAASFIGGIVLCAGLVAIIFFGMKFYKAKTERNYSTL